MPYRFAAALATVAFAVGATTAFADRDDDPGDRHDHGDRHEHGDRHDDHGRHHGHRNHRDDGKILRAELFGSQPAGPVLFGVKPGGAPWVIDTTAGPRSAATAA